MIELKARKLSTWKEKTEGLLVFDKPEVVFFKTRFGIHTFFMKYAIDVLILDKKGRVVKIRSNLKPERFYFWNPCYSDVVELPNGTIGKRGIKVGDFITLKISN